MNTQGIILLKNIMLISKCSLIKYMLSMIYLHDADMNTELQGLHNGRF